MLKCGGVLGHLCDIARYNTHEECTQRDSCIRASTSRLHCWSCHCWRRKGKSRPMPCSHEDNRSNKLALTLRAVAGYGTIPTNTPGLLTLNSERASSESTINIFLEENHMLRFTRSYNSVPKHDIFETQTTTFVNLCFKYKQVCYIHVQSGGDKSFQ